MASNPQLSMAAVDAEAEAVGALLDAGYLRLYDGVQPATADTPIGASTLLAELRFAVPAFGAAAAGIVYANALEADTAAAESGTATWFRAVRADGLTGVFDGSVGTDDAGLVMNAVEIAAGAIVSVSSFTFTAPASRGIEG